jgi:hypothetical protein
MVFSLTTQNRFYQPNNFGNLISIGTVQAQALNGMQVGIPQPQLASISVAPTVASNTSLASAVTGPTSASYIPLTAGANITVVSGVYNSITNTTDTVYFFDTPRTVVIALGGGGAPSTIFTVWGFDQDDVFMTEQITVTNGNTVIGKKAFAGITRVWAASATTSTVSVGVSNIIGLPYVLNNVNRIISGDFGIPTVITVIPATGIGTNYTIADQTATATAITGDIRGTVLLPSAADGIKRLVVAWIMAGNSNDVNNQTYGTVYGVSQYAAPYN